jgi:hypothetical protein
MYERRLPVLSPLDCQITEEIPMFRPAVAFVPALLLVPAIASGVKAPTLRAGLGGPAGYCQAYDAAAGFHAVHADVRIRGARLAPGSYQV